MKTTGAVALSLLAAFVAAVPTSLAEKRDVAYTTEYKQVLETVVMTTTVWVDEMPTTADSTSKSRTHRHGHATKASSSDVVEPSSSVVVEAPSTSSTPVYTTPVVESSSSVYVAPTSSEYVESSAVATSTPVEIATTPAVVSTTPTSSVYVAPATSSAPAESVSSESTTSSASSDAFYGKITYYTPGLGACGWTNSESDHIVALAEGVMGSESNGNEWCGKNITIEYEGKTTTAYIADKCPGCQAPYGLDLTPGLFEAVGVPQASGTAFVNWWVS